MSVVGVDFGCQNAVIAAAGRGGVDVILNGNSNRLNPNMVSFDASRTFGEGASSSAISNYKNCITSMKRLVGLSFDDPKAEAEMKLAPFTCVPIKRAGGNAIGVKVYYNSEEKIIPVEVVAGMMVKHMGSIVANHSATTSSADPASLFPQDWVVAVPSYYNDSQRQAFLTGCEVAGIPTIQRLMQETTATALAYGIFKDIRKEFEKSDKPTHVMFLDLGATSYQVCIAAFEPGKLTIKTTQFDDNLGGRDFDMKIAQHFADKFEEKYKNKLSGKPMSKPKVVKKLLVAAEKAKKTLSPFGVKETRINLECIMDDLDFGLTLKAKEYEEMIQPLLNRLSAPIERALAEAKITAKDLKSVEIVGGSSRIGSVKRTLAGILGLDVSATNNGLSTTMNADEAVSRGAALQSAILSPRFKVLPYEIIEFQPFPVKVSWEGDANGEEGEDAQNSVTMFERGSNFPCVRRVTLRRSGDFAVQVAYDDSAAGHGYSSGTSKEIATFKIKAPDGALNKIRVNVKQDLNGGITLSSAQLVEEIVEPEAESETKEEEKADGEKDAEKKKKVKKTNLQFSISKALEWTKAEFDAAYEAEVEMTNIDRVFKETADSRNELESYVYDMRDKIISESHLKPFCGENEANRFSDLLEKTENWLYEEGFDATKSVYVEKLAQLKKIGDPIAFRKSEAALRPNAFSTLQTAVENYSNWLNTSVGDEKYSHITDEDRQKCHQKCDEVSSWMYDMMDKTGSMAPTADPIVTASSILSKVKELNRVVSPIMNKPKPKPKPKEEPKAEAKKEEKKAEEGEPMETDEKSEKPDSAEPMDTN